MHPDVSGRIRDASGIGTSSPEICIWPIDPLLASSSARPAGRSPRLTGSRVPASTRRKDVFPVPDGPQTSQRSPAEAAQVTSASARKSPQPAPAAANLKPTFFLTFILTFGYLLANFERLVLGCIEAEFCK